MENFHNQQVAMIARNIELAIRTMQSEGITGCSFDNLHGVTSTLGVMVPIGAYHRFFDEAAQKVATKLKADAFCFKLYN